MMFAHSDSTRSVYPISDQLIPVDLKNLLQVPKAPVPWLVENLLVLGRGHLLVGLGASSKSTWLTQLSIGIATGVPTFPSLPITEKGAVVLALAENTPEDAFAWIGELVPELGLSEEHVEALHQKLHVFALAGRDATLLSTSHGRLQSTSLFDQFLKYCQSIPDLKLIGLDPAIAFTQGRELDENHQRQLANLVENIAVTTGACVVLISHAAKGSQYQTEIGSHVSRGSGALTDALRLEMMMKVMSAKEAKQYQISEADCKSYVRLQVTKANRLPPDALQAKWFKRGPAGTLISVILNHTVASKAPSSSQRRLQQAASLINTYEAIDPVAVSFKEWRERFARGGLLTGGTEHAQEVSARRLLASLAEHGWAEQAASGLWRVKAAKRQTNASCTEQDEGD